MRPNDNEPIRSRRGVHPALIVAILVAVGLLILASVGAAVVYLTHRQAGGGIQGSGIFGPSPSVEGVNWNMKELMAHIDGKGVPIEWEPVGRDAVIGTKGQADRVANMVDWVNAAGYHEFSKDGPIVVSMRADPQSAHDAAGSVKPPTVSFEWGRFYFYGHNRELMEKVRAAIK